MVLYPLEIHFAFRSKFYKNKRLIFAQNVKQIKNNHSLDE